MQKLKTFLTVIGAVTVLVLAANSAVYAATGGKFILGKTNKAGAASTLKRTTSGTALNLVTKSSSNAPLSVNGKGKVTNLNADTVDGLDSSALRNHSYVFTSSFSGKSSVTFNLPVPAGTYVVSYSMFFSGLASSGGIQCYVVQDNTTGTDPISGWEALVYTNDPSWKPALAGTGLATKGATSSIRVECNGLAGAWDTSGNSPLQIIATPTTVVSSTPLTARVAPGGARLLQH